MRYVALYRDEFANFVRLRTYIHTYTHTHTHTHTHVYAQTGT